MLTAQQSGLVEKAEEVECAMETSEESFVNVSGVER